VTSVKGKLGQINQTTRAARFEARTQRSGKVSLHRCIGGENKGRRGPERALNGLRDQELLTSHLRFTYIDCIARPSGNEQGKEGPSMGKAQSGCKSVTGSVSGRQTTICGTKKKLRKICGLHEPAWLG